jgi:hypothetical protein
VGGQVIALETFKAAAQAGYPLPKESPPFLSRYAYGFIVGEFQAGDVQGFLSYRVYFPKIKTTLIVLSNLESVDFLQVVVGTLNILNPA